MIRDTMTLFRTTSKEKGNRRGYGLHGIAACIFFLLAVSGCTPKLYNVNMRYEPTKAIQPTQTDGQKYSVTVASFIDRRKIDDTILIGRVISSDGIPIPVLPKYVTPTDAVSAALRELMFKSGYLISPEKPSWSSVPARWPN